MYFSLSSAIAKKINANAKPVRTPTLTIKYLADEQYKYTVVISKKSGNAVQRNRVKRAIRDIMRQNRDKFQNGLYLMYYNKRCDNFDRESLLYDLEKILK